MVWRRSCPSMRRKTRICSTTPTSATTTKAAMKLEVSRNRCGRDGVADIAAEQVERAVREIDVAHQPEDQGEAAGHQEIQAAERDAVKNGVEEHALLAEGVLQPRRPVGENQPHQADHHRGDRQRPGRMALQEPVHRADSARLPCPSGAGCAADRSPAGCRSPLAEPRRFRSSAGPDARQAPSGSLAPPTKIAGASIAHPNKPPRKLPAMPSRIQDHRRDDRLDGPGAGRDRGRRHHDRRRQDPCGRPRRARLGGDGDRRP